MGRLFSFGTFFVAGVMLADVLIHPQGTAQASIGAARLEVPALSSLLGGANVQTYQ